MIHRTQDKTITREEVLSQRPDYAVSCDIEDILCKDYVYLLDSMDMENFEYDDTSFDVFKEIVYKNRVVGFVSYFNQDGILLLMESYIMPEYRNNNLLCNDLASNTNLALYQPKIDFVQNLIECNKDTMLSEGVVISEILFNTSSFNLKKRTDLDQYYSHVYDINNGSILLLDKESFFNYSLPNQSDVEKYGLNVDMDDDYLNKVYNIVFNYNEDYLKVLNKI